MFKKQFTTKTEVPLRGSDRRKLRASLAETYLPNPPPAYLGRIALPPATTPNPYADMLAPEDIRSTKFTTSLGDKGTLYTSNGDPLWFKDSDDAFELLPTVYLLWRISLLPIITTPPVAIDSLFGGSDLFIPGIFTISPPSSEPGSPVDLKAGAAVAIASTKSPMVPVAVGRLAVDTKDMKDDEKGKAVHVLHTWKDTLWSSGSKEDPPSQLVPLLSSSDESAAATGLADGVENLTLDGFPQEPSETGATVREPSQNLTPEEADALLHEALLHYLHTLAQSPAQTPELPISSSTFYSAYILPNRRFIPTPPDAPSPASQDIMKRSSYKKLAKFLAAVEKEGLIRTKQIQKPSPDTLIMALNISHPNVGAHASANQRYKSVAEEEAKTVRREKAGKEREDASAKGIEVLEYWKVHGRECTAFFANATGAIPNEQASASTKEFYTAPELKALLDAYIASRNLVHPREKRYVLVDAERAPLLRALILPPPPKKKKAAAEQQAGASAVDTGDGQPDFLPREDVLPKLKKAMQAWYEVRKGDKEGTPKKGTLSPVNVTTAKRAGRKLVTLVTNFEPFLLDADALAESLRKSCAGATSVAPREGAGAGAGMEVLVQGEHVNAAVALIMAEGVPEKWIKSEGAKKKK
ncbi:hypothetical protein DL93DRAFT_2109956 [Clavulina sp. PMI_390]|nr:hypothetical protein DL93DRAFT_2109956 [Clavulina sp. PMI_390]